MHTNTHKNTYTHKHALQDFSAWAKNYLFHLLFFKLDPSIIILYTVCSLNLLIWFGIYNSDTVNHTSFAIYMDVFGVFFTLLLAL